MYLPMHIYKGNPDNTSFEILATPTPARNGKMPVNM